MVPSLGSMSVFSKLHCKLYVAHRKNFVCVCHNARLPQSAVKCLGSSCEGVVSLRSVSVWFLGLIEMNISVFVQLSFFTSLDMRNKFGEFLSMFRASNWGLKWRSSNKNEATTSLLKQCGTAAFSLPATLHTVQRPFNLLKVNRVSLHYCCMLHLKNT